MSKGKARIIWILLLAFLLTGVGYLIYQWVDYLGRRKTDEKATFIKPRLLSTFVTINSFTRERTGLYMTFLIDNPSPFGIMVDSMRYSIFIGGREVMKGTTSDRNVLRPGDSSKITFPFVVENRKIINILRDMKAGDRDSVEYRVDFDLYTDLPFLEGKRINYEYSELGPMLIPPDIELAGIKVHRAGLRDADMTMRLRVINSNSFPYRFRKSYYKLKLDDKFVASGYLEDLVIIPARGEETIDIPVHMKTKAGVTKLIKLYTRPRNTSYYFYIEAEVISASPRKNSKIYFEMYDDQVPPEVFGRE